MHTAESITHADSLQQLSARSGNARSFDALYDVFAMNGTDLNGTLLLTGTIDTARIWADEAPAAPAASRAPSAPGALPPTARLPSNPPRKPRYAATVQRVQRLTPRMMRIVFGGPALAGFNWNGPAAHIKLILGPIGAEPQVRPLSRTYTPRHFDAARLRTDRGLRAARRGSRLHLGRPRPQVGQPMVIAGPGRCYAFDPQAQWLLIAGDESAIPAIATILEVVPDHVRTQVLIEVNDAADEFAIAAAACQREPALAAPAQRPLEHGSAGTAGIELTAAVAAFEAPAGTGSVYVACEADAMRRIRRHLLVERALPREWVTTRGYWKQGATDHPDRDYGEDVG